MLAINSIFFKSQYLFIYLIFNYNNDQNSFKGYLINYYVITKIIAILTLFKIFFLYIFINFIFIILVNSN
jgi:hypothetical protein